MLHFLRKWWIGCLICLVACANRIEPTWGNNDPLGGGYIYHSSDQEPSSNTDGSGGAHMQLTIPFLAGEWWMVTQGYGAPDGNTSHRDYGFRFGNDQYALDFSQAGCEAYGKPVTPLNDGIVMDVRTDGVDDQGYGNTVLIDHDNGYVSRYAHLSEVFVTEGQVVNEDDWLGRVGNTGSVYGVACGSHPGTHLHLVLYEDEEAVPIEPISGIGGLQTGCWYSRWGEEDCSGGTPNQAPNEDAPPVEEPPEEQEPDPGAPVEEVVDNDLNIRFMDVFPDHGTAGQTNFVWVAVADSPGHQPDATLWVHNPSHGVDYSFTMNSDSVESPWVFTYRKTLSDHLDYDYWVEVDNGPDYVTSDQDSIEVDPAIGDPISNVEASDYSSAGGTLNHWDAEAEHDDDLDFQLHLVNAQDAMVYDFDMTLGQWTDVDVHHAHYHKELRDAGIYHYWVSASNGNAINTSTVQSLEANP